MNKEVKNIYDSEDTLKVVRLAILYSMFPKSMTFSFYHKIYTLKKAIYCYYFLGILYEAYFSILQLISRAVDIL